MCAMTLIPVRATGWRRPIGCLKLQVIFRKRATNYKALLQKITNNEKASCMTLTLVRSDTIIHASLVRALCIYICTYTVTDIFIFTCLIYVRICVCALCIYICTYTVTDIFIFTCLIYVHICVCAMYIHIYIYVIHDLLVCAL